MAFNPLEHPLAWHDPRMLSMNNDFVGHIPFVMALVDLLRPSTIVELGTHMGNSYSALCQAVLFRQMPTRCWAVDTWRGDASMGVYDGDAVLAQLRRYHDPSYGGFSTLLRMDFDAARGQFADGSIDLLHIDGGHSYEAVRHDFETWRGALSPRGVVILHDTVERREGFGVWRFWEELAGQHPSFNFEHAHGLGVLLVGAQPEGRVGEFMATANAQAGAVREFFRFLGRRVEEFQYLVFARQTTWQVQTVLNRWAEARGRPVNAMTEAQAAASPMMFLQRLTMQAKQALEG